MSFELSPNNLDDCLCDAVRLLEGQEVPAVFEDFETSVRDADSRFLGPGAKARRLAVARENEGRSLDLSETVRHCP